MTNDDRFSNDFKLKMKVNVYWQINIITEHDGYIGKYVFYSVEIEIELISACCPSKILQLSVDDYGDVLLSKIENNDMKVSQPRPFLFLNDFK